MAVFGDTVACDAETCARWRFTAAYGETLVFSVALLIAGEFAATAFFSSATGVAANAALDMKPATSAVSSKCSRMVTCLVIRTVEFTFNARKWGWLFASPATRD